MPKTEQRKSNAGGRPLSYDPHLVHTIISKGLAGGAPVADLDVTYVKEKLCNEHGVKDSIRQERLQSLVDAAHAEIREAENQALLAALPDSIARTVASTIAEAEREVLLVVARQHTASQAVADQKCQELRSDKRNVQYRATMLEGELADEQEARKALEKERDALSEELATLREELRIARSDVDRLRSEPSRVDRLLAELRDPTIRDDIRTTLLDIVAHPASAPAK